MARYPGYGDDSLDPEVIADLRFRDASVGDRTRTRPAEFAPSPIVERWPCTGCNTLVDMTRDAIELHAMFNRQLERRRERPLPKRIPCADCKRRDEELVAAQRRPHQQQEFPTTKGRQA